MRSKNPIWRRSVSTAAGEFTAFFSPAGLKELHFPHDSRASTVSDEVTPPATLPSDLRLLQKALDDVLAGRDPRQLPDLDWSDTTSFQQQVWRQLLAIPSGKVRTYGEIAQVLRKPGAARAVGTACGANPIPVLVPCHRVLASGGRLGGFSGGLDWKRKLLSAEGATWGAD